LTLVSLPELVLKVDKDVPLGNILEIRNCGIREKVYKRLEQMFFFFFQKLSLKTFLFSIFDASAGTLLQK